MNRRDFLKRSAATGASVACPTSAAYLAVQSIAIRLGLSARMVPLASPAWYAIVDEAINLSASFPRTEGALFKLFMSQ